MASRHIKAMNETTYQLIEAAEPVLADVRAKLFDAADCERREEQRIASLDKAADGLRMLLKQIEHSRKEVVA